MTYFVYLACVLAYTVNYLYYLLILIYYDCYYYYMIHRNMIFVGLMHFLYELNAVYENYAILYILRDWVTIAVCLYLVLL